MAKLSEIVSFCQQLARIDAVKDFPGAENGLQIENNGTVHKIGSAVDAGQIPFEKAIAEGVDFLIVHHGLFWNPVCPITGKHYRKLKTAIEGNLAVFSCHLPLDAHPEIGNNRLLADALNLKPAEWFLQYEGVPIALATEGNISRDELKSRLSQEFPRGFTSIEFGSSTPERIAILTGSGRSALDEMKAVGADTLITGELRQEHFNIAQEEGFNLYVCGHFATETYGVRALAQAAAQKFSLEHTFIDTQCPL